MEFHKGKMYPATLAKQNGMMVFRELKSTEGVKEMLFKRAKELGVSPNKLANKVLWAYLTN